MHRRPLRSPVLLTAIAAAALVTSAGCSGDEAGPVGSPASQTAAALSSAAEASPGAYGTPANPSLPNPTDVAVDPTSTPATAGEVTVVVTYAGWVDDSTSVEVGAYVPGTTQSGGTCTLTIEGPDAPDPVSVTAEPDASSTACPTMSVPGSGLAAGTYSAVVTFEAPGLSGTSAVTTVVVP